MLHGIEFTDKRFKTEKDYNVLGELTENTIILCNNYKLMDTLAKEILDTVNGQAEYNDYWCDEDDIGKAKYDLSFGLQRVIDINGQKITLSLEPSIIYKANKLEEIWLFDCQGTDEIETLPPYKEFIYPLFIFKGSKKTWEEDSKDAIYKNICNGRYGCFDGKWINLDGNNTDERIRYCEGKYELRKS